ncbi:DUF1906 domain-containing protein [Bacillus sp. BRMEA1]|uniref:glycoside hydrolase domain-containing protein n=1 Tax=Neobacillus endophyticus TaxID=2738405 RepID=UPI001563529A|nr:glycoside hydrolase domain-containing protein [Neobacillus endophyticus]NRD80072.1 DUF1906 domain-containing protein [Neobacillus endophyticus]
MVKVVWGVDSSVSVNDEVLNCVQKQFGHPDFWGRYLSTVPGTSEGLTKNEILFLKAKGIKILPIYNNFEQSVGKSNGVVAARNAVYNASRLGIRKGTVIFANIERFFDVDAQWLIGWVETLYTSVYRPGFYFDPIVGDFNGQYCKAINESTLMKNQSILWSAKPEKGISNKRSHPKYAPRGPNCSGNVWAWQYGRDAKVCPIDTNLAEMKLFELMH